jgi:hypothetical protein
MTSKPSLVMLIVGHFDTLAASAELDAIGNWTPAPAVDAWAKCHDFACVVGAVDAIGISDDR